MQRTSCHSIKKSQNKAKRPNIFFKAKQEMKKPKSSYLAAKKPSYQPCFHHVESVAQSNSRDLTPDTRVWGSDHAKFGFKSCITRLCEGSLPIILSSLVQTIDM